MHVFLWPLMALAATGLALSFSLHLVAWTGHMPALLRPLAQEHSRVLFAGIFVVWIPAALMAQHISPGGGAQFSWKRVLAGCPLWMRTAIGGLFAYAFVNFFVSIGQAKTSEWGHLRAFTGHGMLFYGMALAIFYSASRMPRLLQPRQCPLGHAVEHQHQFCPTCGASLPDDPAAPL